MIQHKLSCISQKKRGCYLAMNETCFSNGELYTILTNMAQKGFKGAIVTITKGTKSDFIIGQIKKYIPKSLRNKVKKISLDMAGSMNLIAKICFAEAERVIDRFHAQKLASEAVQYLRIKYKREEVKNEKKREDAATKNNKPYTKEVFSNGESRKQVFVRSRYLLFKPRNRWSLS